METKLKDIAGEEGRIVVNYTKLKKKIQQCEQDKLNQTCRRELQDMGIEWA